ncbi:MAG TPA: hypothetical protein VIH76_05535 [Candidatus Acidoferrales bacterium]
MDENNIEFHIAANDYFGTDRMERAQWSFPDGGAKSFPGIFRDVTKTLFRVISN